MIVPVRVSPIGGLNKDNDPQYVQGGDYIDAKNVRPVSNDGGTTGRLETILGNEKVFEIGSVATQIKSYRVVLKDDQTYNYHTITIKDVNGTTVANGTFAAVIGDFATSFANAQTALNSALPAGYVASYVEDTTNGYLDITLDIGSNGYSHEWTLTSTGIYDFAYYVLTEAIDVSIVGDNNVIGSYDSLGELFIWSTPKTVKPSNIEIDTISLVSGVSATITTREPHGLTSGEYIKIYSPSVTTTHGKFIVTVTGTLTFTLDNVLPGSTSSTSPTDSFITKDIYGYGVIGVATKNVSGAWSYTKLIASKGLNFVTKHQIDGTVERDASKVSLYFTDDYNAPRTMYYIGDYSTNGFLNVVNSENIYTYDGIDEQSRLVLGEPNIKFSSAFSARGGYLTAGNKRYAVRLLTDSFDITSWSYLSNPTHIIESAYGSASGTITSSRVILTIDGIPDNTYKYIELAVVEYSGTAISGYIVKRETLPTTIPQNGVEIIHYGNETETQTLDLGTLAVTEGTVLSALNIEAIDNRCVLSNLSLSYDYDLSEWAQGITYSLGKKALTSIGYINTTLAAYEYYQSLNTFANTGYMDNETYRFGVQVKWKNGGWSKAYHVDDVTFDTTTAGRKTGLSNYNLTDASTGNMYSTYIQFGNVDLDFVLSDGSILRDKIEAFRFVRAECVPEIMFTGFMILGVNVVGYKMNETYWDTAAGTYGGTGNIGILRGFDLYLGKVQGISKGVYDEIYFETGDTIINHGNPQRIYNYVKTASTEQIVEYNGYFNGTPTSHTVSSDTIWTNGAATVDALTWFTRTNNDTPGIVTSCTPSLINTSGNSDYGIYYVQFKRPQTNKYGDTEDTEYITTGHIETDLSAISTASTFQVFGGDTFTQKTYMTTENDTTTPRNYAVSIYTQNRSNAQLRLLDTSASSGALFPNPTLGTTSAALDAYLTQGEDTRSEGSYDIKNNVQSYMGFDASLPETGDAPSRIMYSSVKAQGSVKDNYRIFLPLNYKDLPLEHGEITHMAVGNGELLTWQPRSFMRQFFNSRGVLQTGDGVEVLIGNGAVLDRDGVQLSLYGTKHKWSVIKGKSAGGKDTFYWLNTEYGKLLRFGYDGTVALSDIKGMMSFFAESLKYVDSHTTPADNYGICGVFHNRFGEAIFTSRALSEGSAWATSASYVLESGVYVSGDNSMTFEGFPQVYICKLAHTSDVLNKPGSGANWTTYWTAVDPNDYDYSSIFSIVFSEVKNKATSFYTHKPKIYLPFKDTFLSPHPTQSNYIYEHNRGSYSRWYDIPTTKTGQSISFTAGSSTVTGTGTDFVADMPNPSVVVYYVSDGTTQYEVTAVTNGTSIEVYPTPDTTVTVNNYTFYSSNSEDAHVEMVTNIDPNASKHWMAQQINSDSVPYRLDHTTEDHESYVEEGDFETRENFHYAPVMNDTLTGGGLNNADSTHLFGKWLKTKVTFKKNLYNSIFNFITKSLSKGRLYNK